VLVSFIIPTRNEAADIRLTLDALAALDHPEIEVLVVDASTDKTPDIVHGYAELGMRLLPQTRRGGRAEARNQGIMAARGEIVVILNADVRPQSDFVERILTHYRAGADMLGVESLVTNTERLLPRYTQATHVYLHGPAGVGGPFYWTEGFSCRRAAALEAGLFPETVPPLVAGEDAVFVHALLERGCRYAFDRSIVVRHTTPERLAEWWHNRVGRGQGGAQRRLLVDGMPTWRLALAFVASTLVTAVQVGLIVPLLVRGLRLARYSPRGLTDALPFVACYGLEEIAARVGNWRGLIQVVRAGPHRRMAAIRPDAEAR
jgi:hypothetical protein